MQGGGKKMNDLQKKEAQEIASNMGLTNISTYGTYKGSEIILAENIEDKTPAIGYPTFIIIGDPGETRVATIDETLEILEISPVNAATYKGEEL